MSSPSRPERGTQLSGVGGDHQDRPALPLELKLFDQLGHVATADSREAR